MQSRPLSWLLASLALALAGCYTVPETGRQSFIVISPSEESQLGATEFANLKAKQKVSTDPAHNEQVTRVGRRIAEAVGNQLPTAKWEFVVFDAPKTVNAFALPGGKVGVYSGLLKLCDSDDELATVMGHEIGHVTARHGAERMTEAMGLAVGAVLVDVATQSKPSSTRNAWLIGYGAAGLGTALKFSRNHESEADYIGIRYAAKAGYDPRASISFWKKMAKDKNEPGGFLGFVMELTSTHPVSAARIAALESRLPEVLPLYEAAKLRHR
jgi:predicted Zn-dependent protease